MESFIFRWPDLLILFGGTMLASALAAGAENKYQGHDVAKSTRRGLVGGVVTALFTCVMTLLIA